MPDVITIGTATRDVFLTSSSFKVLNDPKHLESIGFKTGEAECFALGSKIEVEEPTFTMGGGAANAAVTFSRQGYKTSALLKIGNDEAGEAIIQELKKEKVTPIAVKDKDNSTAYSTILLLPSGERTILVHRGAAESLRKKDVPLSKLNATWAYIAPGGIPFSVMQDIIKQLKSKGASIAMNLSKDYLSLGEKKLKLLLKPLDIVIVNQEEAAQLTGIEYKKEKAIFSKFNELVSGIAVMTEGPKGALVSDGKYLYRSGTFKEKQQADRTGAGDAFGSGFVAGLLQRNDVHYALRLASANATSVVENIGAQTGILNKADFKKSRWQYLDLDIDPV